MLNSYRVDELISPITIQPFNKILCVHYYPFPAAAFSC